MGRKKLQRWEILGLILDLVATLERSTSGTRDRKSSNLVEPGDSVLEAAVVQARERLEELERLE
eukprot:c47373_g1_i1 orf=88-279(-)